MYYSHGVNNLLKFWNSGTVIAYRSIAITVLLGFAESIKRGELPLFLCFMALADRAACPSFSLSLENGSVSVSVTVCNRQIG